MDPLVLLREASMAGALGGVVEDGGRIAFGDRYAFPKVRCLARMRCCCRGLKILFCSTRKCNLSGGMHTTTAVIWAYAPTMALVHP